MADARDCLLVRFAAPGGRNVMTLPAPADLRFDSEVPGGYRSLSCTVYVPAGAPTPAALVAFAEVLVTDRRTSGTVWCGVLTDPGLSVGVDGAQTYAVTAEGPQVRLDGWREVYGLVDRSSESWQAVGEFQGSQASIGGPLAPPGDYDFDLPDFGDLLDFGDELSVDFDGDLFGGDLGDFGQIDFAGADYPAGANYPGYLGFLQDPFGDIGDQLPIPLGDLPVDGSWWNNWEAGHTATGSSATGTTTGTLTVGAGGGIGRHKKTAYGGILTTEDATNHVDATFRLNDSAVKLRLWGWTETDMAYQGFYLEITTSNISIWRVDSGVAVQLATASASITVGVTCSATFDLWPDGFPVDTGDWVLHGIVVSGGTGEVSYSTVDVVPYIGDTGRWWGVSAAGAATESVSFDSVNILGLD